MVATNAKKLDEPTMAAKVSEPSERVAFLRVTDAEELQDPRFEADRTKQLPIAADRLSNIRL